MKLLLRELLRAILIGTLIFVVVLAIYAIQGKINWQMARLPLWYGQFMMFGVPIYLANSGVFILLDRIFGKGRMSGKRLVAGFIASMAASVLAIFLLTMVHEVMIAGKTIRQFFATHSPSDYTFSITITVIVSFVMHAFYFYRRYQENRVKEQKIIAGVASARFESLKNQIDPHFLFNSLNVLSSLIEEDPDNAQRFTTSLSKVYRYVLEQKDKELVSVAEELSFAKTYMNLLKMRFENSLQCELPQSLSNPDSYVVPLSLQLLLENTIKHNVVSPQRPLHIRIYEEDGYLVVQNHLQKKEVLQDRRGVGLQNILSRYAILTSRKVVISDHADHFTVKIPVLTQQVQIMETRTEDSADSYLRAQKKVEDIKGFYGNLFSYVVVNAGLAILNLVTTPDHLWFFYPLIGWGVGVAIHAISVFNMMPFLGADWEERKIRELLDRDKGNRWR